MRTSLHVLSSLLIASALITAQAQTTTTAPASDNATPAAATAGTPTPESSTATTPSAPAAATEAPAASITPAASSPSVTHWLCGEKATPVVLTNDDNKGLVQIGNDAIEMKRAQTETGIHYNAADGSDASFTVVNNAAVLVAANKEKTSCALVEQPAAIQ